MALSCLPLRRPQAPLGCVLDRRWHQMLLSLVFEPSELPADYRYDCHSGGFNLHPRVQYRDWDGITIGCATTRHAALRTGDPGQLGCSDAEYQGREEPSERRCGVTEGSHLCRRLHHQMHPIRGVSHVLVREFCAQFILSLRLSTSWACYCPLLSPVVQ